MLYCSKNGISIYAGQNEGCLVKAERKDNQVVIYLNSRFHQTPHAERDK